MIKDSKKWGSMFLLVCTCFAWGASFVSIEICLKAMGPSYLSFFRYIVATIILGILVKANKQSFKIEKKDIPKLIAVSLFGTTLYFYFESNGIMRIGANEAAVLGSMTPISALIANRIFLKQKILLRNVVSAAISIVGIYLVIGGVGFTENKIGYLFILLSTISWAGYLITAKTLLGKYNGLVMAFYQCMIGMLGFIPSLGIETIYPDKITLSIILHFLFLAIFCSAMCTWLYAVSIENLGVGISAMMINFIPIATFLFSFIFLGEVMKPIKMVGAAIAILGLLLIKEDEALEKLEV